MFESRICRASSKTRAASLFSRCDVAAATNEGSWDAKVIDATGHAADDAARRIAPFERADPTHIFESYPSPDVAMDTSRAPMSNPEGERRRYTVAIAVTSRDSSHASTR